jgi:DNA-binding IclR family transcriptional regulator
LLVAGHDFRARSALVQVEHDSSHPGFACLELARSYQINNRIQKVALPELEVLRDQTTETIHLAILDNMEVVYLEKLHGLHAIGLMSSYIGGRALAYCTGLGKVLLAYSDVERVRAHFERVGFTLYQHDHYSVDELIRHLDVYISRLCLG